MLQNSYMLKQIYNVAAKFIVDDVWQFDILGQPHKHEGDNIESNDPLYCQTNHFNNNNLFFI